MIFKRGHTSISRNFQLANRTYNFCIVLNIFVTLSEVLTSQSFFLQLCPRYTYIYMYFARFVMRYKQWEEKHKSCNVQLILLYFLIGIWSRDIRYKSNLPLTEINKILKNLESKKLIKAVKSVAVSSLLFSSPERSLYMYFSKYISGSYCSLSYVVI